MPGYRTQIAQGMTTNQSPEFQKDTASYAKPYFVGAAARPTPFGGALKEGDSGYSSDGHMGRYMTGPQGAGIYRAPTALQMQQGAATEFRSNIPTLENQMGHQMAGEVGGQMDQGIKTTQQQDSSRGLLYGGIHAGREQGVRATASGQLAKGRSAINKGLLDAANSMDASAIQSGLQVQQQQQQMQNAIYAQAMAKMNADNAGFSGLLQAGGMIAGGYLAGA